MTKRTTFPKQPSVYSTGADFVNSNGDKKFYRGKGRTKDRNIDTWEDRRQNRLIREWLASRKKSK